jgi:hypothetical protein
MKPITGVCLTVLLIASVGNPLPTLRDETSFPNRADVSQLPRGLGLAAGFIADRGIEINPAVIFADQFETENDGGLAKRWDSAGAGGGRYLTLEMAVKKGTT